MGLADFELIEQKIKNHRQLSAELNKKRERLQEVFKLLKEARKDQNLKSVREQILILNTERQMLKESISELKKLVNKEYNEAEKLILDGISFEYSEVYEKQLSRLYGVKMSVIYKKMGDDFDEETCIAQTVIATKDKKQHFKIIDTISFGVKNLDSNVINQKARVAVCYYTKKFTPGTVIPLESVII